MSSFHPEWRQSQHWKELTNSDQIISAVQQRYPVFSCDSSVAVADQYKKPPGLGLWEVTLSAGDMLYLPAGFYHTVTAGADSVSVNAWFPSKLSQVSNIYHFIPFSQNNILSVFLVAQKSRQYRAPFLQEGSSFHEACLRCRRGTGCVAWAAQPQSRRQQVDQASR